MNSHTEFGRKLLDSQIQPLTRHQQRPHELIGPQFREVQVFGSMTRYLRRLGRASFGDRKNLRQVLDVAVWAVLFGIVGGRLYHVVTTPDPYWGEGGDPLDAVKIWEGGLGIWGAIFFGGVGAWIACLAALARPERVKALVLVAPAADFTETLMRPGIPPEGRAALEGKGVWLRPSAYGEPYPITRGLLDDGARWSILGGETIPIGVPVRILQGAEDPDVPWRHALELAQALKGPDVHFDLIKDGDHRLSRPRDLAHLVGAVEEMVTL